MVTPQSNNKLYYCPVCHRQITLPPMLKDMDAKINISTNGKVNIRCGHCRKGKIQIAMPSNSGKP